MKRVQSFETRDGQLFHDKGEALTHEIKLDIKGLIQSNTLGRVQNVTPAHVAEFIVSHGKEVADLLRAYREKMRHVTKAH